MGLNVQRRTAGFTHEIHIMPHVAACNVLSRAIGRFLLGDLKNEEATVRTNHVCLFYISI